MNDTTTVVPIHLIIDHVTVSMIPRPHTEVMDTSQPDVVLAPLPRIIILHHAANMIAKPILT